MSRIVFAEDAWEEYLYWQSQDKKILKKINGLLTLLRDYPVFTFFFLLQEE
ncbi:MAG: type II toxin-antitoxin system YoeB family toxin [Lachnospiraceae bacterium]|nr:type II toxin-antitoxin system YoeB family toxin [Lachnospiraceae bacterium]